jgi:hypothetical protein
LNYRTLFSCDFYIELRDFERARFDNTTNLHPFNIFAGISSSKDYQTNVQNILWPER